VKKHADADADADADAARASLKAMKRLSRPNTLRAWGPKPQVGTYSRARLDVSSRRFQTGSAAATRSAADPVSPRNLPHNVTVDDILQRRAKAGRLVAGTAAYSDSDMFKAPVCLVAYPQALCLLVCLSVVVSADAAVLRCACEP
jgi:hypothetical protein